MRRGRWNTFLRGDVTRYLTGGFGKIINGQKNVFQPKAGKGTPITNGWDWLSVPLDEGDYFTNLFFNRPVSTATSLL